MKIFIGGSRGIKTIDEKVEEYLQSIYKNGHFVIIGDACGADYLVQEYFHNRAYENVTVFACEGKARNNAGAWQVENVAVKSEEKDFLYYSQKDAAMAKAADCGFMIWNGKSKGTLNNIINLMLLNKNVSVYLTCEKELFEITDKEAMEKLISFCDDNTKEMYIKLKGACMRSLYIRAIEKYIESEQMKNYLIENVDKLEKWQITDLICGARADLTEKYETLKEIAVLEGDKEAEDLSSASTAAKKAKAALKELELKEGEVFIKSLYNYDRELKAQVMLDASPHFSLQPVIDFFNKEYSTSDDKRREEVYWYELNKFVPGVVDDMGKVW